METQRLALLVLVGLIIITSIYLLERSNRERPDEAVLLESEIEILSDSERIEQKKELYENAKDISTPDGFINTDAFTIEELIGKEVILVDFWTYSCINCQRTLPHLNAWHEKYADKGLTIIGLHTPEFKFEEEYENVVQAVEKFGVEYPVVLDNDFSTWHAYKNRFWPRKYLIDIDGFIVYDHIGEGAYDETELKIRELLQERSEVLKENVAIGEDLSTPEQVDIFTRGKVGTHEIYFGSARNELLGNGERFIEGVQNFTQPETIGPNQFYLSGSWDVQPEFATNKEGGARILLNFTAQKVFMVAHADTPVTARVGIDGAVITTQGGGDVVDGTITFHEERLYHIIDTPDGPGNHTLELIIDDPGLKAFTFTFG